MNIPTLEFANESNLEELADELDIKLNSSADKIDKFCSLIDVSISNVVIQYDFESMTVEFVADSDFHVLNVIVVCHKNFNYFLDIYEPRLGRMLNFCI